MFSFVEQSRGIGVLDIGTDFSSVCIAFMTRVPD